MKANFIIFVKKRYKELIQKGEDPENAYTLAASEWIKQNKDKIKRRAI